MNLSFTLPEFFDIDEKLFSIRKRGTTDPLIAIIKQRFQEKITLHLTSLKASRDGVAHTGIDLQNNNFEKIKQTYFAFGKEKAVVKLFSDMSRQKLSTSVIMLLSEILFEENQYRKNKKYILNNSGERQPTTPANKVPAEMEKLVEWYNTNEKARKVHPVIMAAYLHYKLTTIHPFDDWNGRIARLLLNLALMKKGYLPILIGPEERQTYYEKLEHADKGNMEPLIRFFAQKELETIDDFINSPEYLSISTRYDLEKKLENMNKGERCIVLTEDSATNNLLAYILEASGLNMNETNIISYEGCSKISSANLFSVFVKQKMPGVRIIVHRDRDYLTNAEINVQKQLFQRIDTHLFVTKGTDIESYFLNARHIHHCHPSVDENKAKQLIAKAFEDVFAKSVDYLWKKEFGGHKTEEHSHLGHAVEEMVRSNLKRFIHGKTALKVLGYHIQDVAKENVNLEQASPHLYVKELHNIAKSIWDKQNLS
ncbi:MAG: Fic family protein [Prolixibacteraceae bacterium]|nr:Fic family protein [Prolixibacteraceae bacterium]